jgi:8-oxo-dGTP pyrophosphatase MutT (NUDIX family)
VQDRSRLAAIVSNITPVDVIEADHQSDTLGWIASDAVLYRYRRPAEPPKHLVAYFVLVDLDGGAVLLVDHRKARRWLPTGGHVEPGEDPLATVYRELLEELGIATGLIEGVSSNPLLVTQTKTVGQDAGHVDVSLWYVLRGSTTMEFSPDLAEFVAVRWWTFDEIAAASAEMFDPHLPRFVDKLRRDLAAIPEPLPS